MTTNFDERRARRIERLRAAAERKRREGSNLVEQAHKMADVIPFGQPILVGHYSEQRDRNYRNRIESKFRKGFETQNEAAALEQRADAAESNTAISSDDPNAVEKIKAQIVKLEELQETMKAANKLVRKNDRGGLAALGFSESRIDQLFTPDFIGRLGFPSYEVTNNGANIRRLKERVKTLESHAHDETTETVIGDCRIVDSVEDNRLQMFFPSKPDDAVRSRLKSNGFRWTPTLGCWQAYRGAYRKQIAEQIANSLVKEQNGNSVT